MSSYDKYNWAGCCDMWAGVVLLRTDLTAGPALAFRTAIETTSILFRLYRLKIKYKDVKTEGGSDGVCLAGLLGSDKLQLSC